jgi:hypothetical protein
MITTNLITFEISFQNNGGETLIFNVSTESLNQLTKVLQNRELYITKIKEYDRVKSSFKRCSLQRLIQCTDHHTELNLILTKK